VLVASMCGKVRHAVAAVDADCDFVIAQGTEAGGHTGDVSSMVLIPEVVDAVSPLPVLAAGGIGTGRQIAAALALGAQGVWLGSLWLTTAESGASPAVLEAYLDATSADTVRSRCYTGKPARMLRNTDAVINLVAILHGSEGEFERTHVRLPAVLAAACQTAGVRRVIHVSAIGAATDAAGMGYRVSALGLGSEAGAAYRRSAGEIANARLDAASLRRLAASGNGRYVALAGDDADLRALGLLDPGRTDAAGRGTAGLAWHDEGYWLLPPLMLVALLAFRRRGGGALAVLVLSFALPLGKAQATDLWRRPDQAEYARMQRGNEAYRSGDYPSAARQYQGIDTATAHYNRGNALAKAGQYPQAIEAYDRALREQPGMADAIANRRAVEAAMKRQQQSGSQQGQQQSQGGQGQGQSNQPSSAQPDAASKAGSQAQQQPSPRQQQGTQQQDKPEQAQDKPEHAQPSAASPQDAQAQQQADRAQRERMQRALQQAREHDGKQASQAQARVKETPEQRERRLANEAWLKRVPDDPGGLLRAKFRLEYERRVAQGRATP